LQEHWLLPFELNILSDTHPDFLATASSAVNIASDLLKGRPYGGTGILYRRKLAKSINVVDINEPRLTAITIDTKLGPTLLVNVYMPTDYGDAESLEEYTDMCAKITALFHDNDSAYLSVIGDFNCGPSTRFYSVFNQFVTDNSLVCSDINRLYDVFTYCRDDGSASSWIDHVLCSKPVDDTISEISVLLDYQCSDHKPLAVCFSGLDLRLCPSGIGHHEPTTKSRDWSEINRHNYLNSLTIALSNVDIPSCLISCCIELNCTDISHHTAIDQYYSNIISVVQETTENYVPARKVACTEHNVPGWSDYVKENHANARAAFHEWVSDGKPRSGASHSRMCTTRAKFKIALRYCRRHLDQMKADARAKDLLEANGNSKFWKGISRDMSSKVTRFANKVGNAVGEQEVCDMWKKHFDNLYNSVPDGGAKDCFISRANSQNVLNKHADCIMLKEVIESIHNQKKGKSSGPNGLQMESFIYGGLKLYIHLSLLFTFFVRHCYLPRSLMETVIKPMVKNKGGDLTDVNNYRAIALSNVETKIFEAIVLCKVRVDSESDAPQFGFKKGHSTGLCTAAVKKTIEYYINRGSHVFACFIDFTKAFDRVNYWKLFNQLLDDGIEVCYVKLLAFWYTEQVACVSWQNTLSDKFFIGNGTRQGGVLSPYLFTRYVRDLLKTVNSSCIGCSIGGIFVNIFAYADDMVLLAPCWSALQELIILLESICHEFDLVCNTKKTVCMMFCPKDSSKRVALTFPAFSLGSQTLQFVSQFRYLGHIINDRFIDDDDIMREVRNLFIRTNMLISRFKKCSTRVKVKLFRAYCLCIYDLALWHRYTSMSFNKLKSCYHKCIKKLFGFARMDSMTGILFDLSLPSFETIVHNCKYVFHSQSVSAPNPIVQHFISIGLDIWC
jgi:exonuclease III